MRAAWGGAFVSHGENNFTSEDFEFVALYFMIISIIALRNPEQVWVRGRSDSQLMFWCRRVISLLRTTDGE